MSDAYRTPEAPEAAEAAETSAAAKPLDAVKAAGAAEALHDDAQFADLLPETRRALLHRLALGQSDGRTPSMVGAVVREGRVVWSGGRGTVAGEEADAQTQYRIGSITKTFVAVLIMRLRDEGLLDLDAAVRTYVDTPEAGDATVAELLAHRSGLSAEARGPWWERTEGELRPALADIFGEPAQPHSAGRVHHYSNPGYALLGAVVERLRGEPWGEVLRREVLEPLGMNRTTLLPRAPHAEGWAVHPWADVLLPEPAVDTGVMAPAGQLWSTAADLCRFAAFLLNGDERVLRAASVAEMRAPEAAPDATWTGGYGLGMQLLRLDGRTYAGHSGSMPGFVAALWTSPEDALAAVVLANRTSCPEATPTALGLVDTVASREPRVPAPWRPLGDADRELLELTGPWYWGASAFGLRLRGGRELELAPIEGAAGRGSRFRPEDDGTWTGLDGYYAGETLKAVRTAEGAVSHLDLGTFVFTREPYGPGDVVPGGVDADGWR